MSFFLTNQNKTQNASAQFEPAAIQYLSDNEDVELSHMKLLYDAVSPRSNNSTEFRPGFRNALIMLYAKIITAQIQEASSEKRRSWGIALHNVIMENDLKVPYEGLDPIEGNLFNEISTLDQDINVEKNYVSWQTLFK